ncbi:Glutamate receptor ionotropic, kainate 4 [Dermatophagoides pteronyssinus]|uniref:Glutamate receptor ionotropic, kainate 4 n=1 Tax=Dermatophagoides pteronyssinus TaxID=6956 RepID=A0ABQ8J355_DERPT|nr:Glutamate receptor ionotropic, kainate 4 [Dermatophagoides pteronyssinus]
MSILSLIIILFFSGNIFHINTLHLNGVTLVPNHPHSDVYVNFFHELMTEISDVGQFSYQLRTLPEAIYGGDIGGNITTTTTTQPQGLIGEIYENHADFIIADMEITSERKKFVQFTRPFMRSKLAALIRKSSSSLLNDNGKKDLREILQQSKRIVIKGSLADRYFKTSSNPLVYHLLPYSIAQMDVAINLVKSERDYALVSDNVRLDLIAAYDCDLQVITTDSNDPKSFGYDFQPEYAIAVERNSPFLGLFEKSIEYLDETGKLELIIDQHWYNQCEQQQQQQIMQAQHQNDFPDHHISIDNDNDDNYLENNSTDFQTSSSYSFKQPTTTLTLISFVNFSNFIIICTIIIIIM